MEALTWNGSSLALNTAYPKPIFSPSERALIQVRLAGICSTDLQIFKGYLGFTGVPGHEFVGTVVDGPAALCGKRVVGEINFACGLCDVCRRGSGRHCPERTVMGIVNADGAFAQYVAVPPGNLHKVPDSVSDEEAVFVEPLAAAFEILEQVQVNLTDEILVLGNGKLGSLCAQVMRLASARVSILGKHEEKLAFLRKAGVRTLHLQTWQARRFDIVIEATGSASGLELALGAVRPRGTLVLKSTMAEKHRVSLAPLVIDEIALIGSRCGPFPPALQALEEKSVSVTPLIEKIYPLAEALAAVEHARRPGARKILLQP